MACKYIIYIYIPWVWLPRRHSGQRKLLKGFHTKHVILVVTVATPGCIGNKPEATDRILKGGW